MEPKSTPTSSLQIVNDELKWNEGLGEYLARRQLNQPFKDYKILSIMGAQSTGKSTLLNALFNTDFQEMNVNVKRSQTTKGISLEQIRANNGPLFVLDVEGSDSEERRDMGVQFERMLCSFALAVSDVIMINMWTTDVGRKAGSSMQLLRNIIKLNIKLLGNDLTPKCVYIVLRDFSEEENLEEIKNKFAHTLALFMTEIQEEIYDAKNPNVQLKMDRIIKYQILTLPHKKFAPEKFDKGVNILREEFMNSKSNAYPPTNPAVPLNGLERYMERLWNKIKSDDTINLPNEQVLVTRFLCERAFQESIQEIEDDLEIFKGRASENLLDAEFLETHHSLTQKAIDFFTVKTRGLDKELVNEFEHKIYEKIDDLVASSSEEQIDLLINKLTNSVFTAEFRNESENIESIEKLQDVFDSLKNSVVESFKSKCKMFKLKTEPATDKEIKRMYASLAAKQVDLQKDAIIAIDKKRQEAFEEEKRALKLKQEQDEEKRTQKLKQEHEEEKQKLKQQQEEEEERKLKVKKENKEQKSKANAKQEQEKGQNQPMTSNDTFLIDDYFEGQPNPTDLLQRSYMQIEEAQSEHNFVPKNMPNDTVLLPNSNDVSYNEDYTSGHHLKKDGSLDMRFKENRTEGLTKDGNPDMRYSVNKSLYSEANTSSISTQGKLKKNGEPDMRYSANRTAGVNMDGSQDLRFKKK